jgi:hypothetical protein
VPCGGVRKLVRSMTLRQGLGSKILYILSGMSNMLHDWVECLKSNHSLVLDMF